MRGIRTAVRRTLKNKLNHKKDGRRIHELKGTGTTLAVKQYWYRHLPEDGWRIYTVALNKARVEPRLATKTGKKKLYNFLARFILEHVPLESTDHVRLVVDKCKNREEIKDFNQYLQSQLEAMLPLNATLHIEHESSQASPGLQAVDLFCWGIYRKYESRDISWYRVFGSRIGYETEYLS